MMPCTSTPSNPLSFSGWPTLLVSKGSGFSVLSDLWQKTRLALPPGLTPERLGCDPPKNVTNSKSDSLSFLSSIIAITLNPHPLKKQTQTVRYTQPPNHRKAGPPADSCDALAASARSAGISSIFGLPSPSGAYRC